MIPRRDRGTDCETPNRIVLDYTDGGEVILYEEIFHRVSALIDRRIGLPLLLLLTYFKITHGENPDYEQRRQNHPDQKSYEPGHDGVALRNPSITRESNRRDLRPYRGVALQVRHYQIADRKGAQTPNRILRAFGVQKAIDLLAHGNRISNACHSLTGQTHEERRRRQAVLAQVGDNRGVGARRLGGIALALTVNRVDSPAAVADKRVKILVRSPIEVRLEDKDRWKPRILGGDYDSRHVERRDLRKSNVLIFLNVVPDPAEQPVQRVEMVRIDASDYRNCALSHAQSLSTELCEH